MKVCVMGANGYLGNSIVELFREKYSVLAYDIMFSCNKYQDVVYVTGDYSDPESYRSLIENSDVIINCIGLSGASNSIKNVLKYNLINVDSHLKFLEVLNSFSTYKKVFFTSSRLVYGSTYKTLVTETQECIPNDFYGVQKHTIEQYIKVYSRIYKNIDFVILRISNPYGYIKNPVETPGYNFINSIIKNIINENPINIYGNGEQQRDYIYLEDIISAIEFLIHKRLSNYEIFNLCYGASISIITFAKLVSEISGKELKINYKDWPLLEFIIETGDSFMSNEKLKSLGWRPLISFADGIKKIINIESNYNDN